MLFNLIKKDILIIKKYVFLTLLIVIAIPPFFAWWAPHISPFLAFLISTVFAEFMICQYLSAKEAIYHKTTALLCATPYYRSDLVKADYAFFIIIFVCCYIVYKIEAIFMPVLSKVSLLSVLSVFTFISLIYGIYIPIQYKLGYERTKFFFIIIIMASPFIFPTVFKSSYITNVLFLNNIQKDIKYVILVVLTVLIFSVSIIVSNSIYAKKELF